MFTKMAVEFRNRQWFLGFHREATLKLLTELNCALIAADDLKNEMQPTAERNAVSGCLIF